jgi:UDP-GlcNAc:undecaprenyl-phosphate GlcNAc-1-phosphate transferase
VVPVVGGIAMFGGVIMAAVMSDQLQRHSGMVLLAAGLMVLIGVLDDRFDLKPQFRLFAHAVAAISLAYGSGFVVHDLGNLLGFGDIPLGWLALPFTVLACMALINAFNMLDGLDGLAGGCALVAFLGLSVIGIGGGVTSSAVMCLSLAGACLGFLMFNLPARFNRGFRTFMGDAGSTLLGFVLAAVALVLVQPTQADVSPAIILWMMPIPIFELFTSTVRRIVKGLSPMQADDGHFHHKLVKAGFSVRLIFALYIGVSALSVGTGLLALEKGLAEPVVFLLFLVFFAAWLGFVRLAPTIAQSLPHRMRRELDNLPH